MAKYVWVDKGDCISCGACGSAAPEIFDFDGNGLAIVFFNGDGNRGVMEIPEEYYEALLDAQDSCPTESIQIADSPFN